MITPETLCLEYYIYIHISSPDQVVEQALVPEADKGEDQQSLSMTTTHFLV